MQSLERWLWMPLVLLVYLRLLHFFTPAPTAAAVASSFSASMSAFSRASIYATGAAAAPVFDDADDAAFHAATMWLLPRFLLWY